MGFSDNLKQIRRERRLSQEELAEQLKVSRQAVSKWEQGNGYPEVETLLLLSEVLSVSLDRLMGGNTEAGEAERAGSKGSGQTGRILIASFDGKSIVNCCRVQASPRFRTGKDEPKYALFGVDGSSFWGTITRCWAGIVRMRPLSGKFWKLKKPWRKAALLIPSSMRLR